MAYLPGTQGGYGVSDVLFGTFDPSGKLPVTWPSDAPMQSTGFNTGGASTLGDQPKVFDQLPGTNFGPGSGYNPLYPFGFGLSYTTFTTGGLSASGPTAGSVTATFTVANTGGREGVDVVPVYVSRPVNLGNVLTPPLAGLQLGQLVGFARVDLTAGQSKTVSVSFPVSELAVTPGDIDAAGPRQVLPGAYQVELSASEQTGFTIH